MIEALKNVALIILIAVLVWFILDLYSRVKSIEEYFKLKSELEEKEDGSKRGDDGKDNMGA